ncbi:hypothetical protein TNCV_2127311 [Trichonephila clavipes]|nr:hypothetical protein TNCV_2127311 [Trichonephila clavipes]
MEVNKEKIQYILQFLLDKGENASPAAEIVNGFYGADTGQNLNSDIYCQQLDRLKLVTDQKWTKLAKRRCIVATYVCSDSPETLGA